MSSGPRRPDIDKAEEQKRKSTPSTGGLVVEASRVFRYLVKAEKPVARLRRPNSRRHLLSTASPHAPFCSLELSFFDHVPEFHLYTYP